LIDLTTWRNRRWFTRASGVLRLRWQVPSESVTALAIGTAPFIKTLWLHGHSRSEVRRDFEI